MVVYSDGGLNDIGCNLKMPYVMIFIFIEHIKKAQYKTLCHCQLLLSKKLCRFFVTLKYCKFSCQKSLNKTASDHFSIFTNRCTPISTLYDIKHRPSKRGVILILSNNFQVYVSWAGEFSMISEIISTCIVHVICNNSFSLLHKYLQKSPE